MIEDHIPAASSFVDKDNIHMLKGWGDTVRVVFDSANRPAVAVGEDKAAHNLMLPRAAEGSLRVGNIHMGNHPFENAEKSICWPVEQVVERDVVTERWQRPALETHWMGPQGEDTSD